MIQTRRNLAPFGRGRRIGFAAFCLAAAAGLPIACRKSETTAAAPSAAPAAPAATPTPAGDIPPVLRASAQPGQAPWAGLAEPRGIALDGQGRIWVTDFGHSRVAIFDASGGLLGAWGGVRGNAPYQLQEPADIAIRGDAVDVADTWNGRVVAFTTAGRYKNTAATGLYGPRGVAIAVDGTVWIADSGNNRLALVSPGQPPRFLGKAGAGPDGFASPVGVAVSPTHAYVADIGNHRLQVLGLDGKFQRSIPIAAWKDTMEPYVAVDDKDDLYVSVPASSAVLAIDRSGKVLHKWETDDAGKKLLKPTGLALDAKAGVLYVADAASNVVTTIRLAEKK
jgi:DNA-binding beta-propeller fold protein YncE